MNALLLATCIAIALASVRLPLLSIGQIPIAVVSIAVLHDWTTLLVSLLSFLAPPLYRALYVAREFGASEGLKSLLRVLAMFGGLSAAIGVVIYSAKIHGVGFAPLLYVPALLLLTAIARGLVEGFRDLPSALEVSGFLIAVIASSLALGKRCWLPLALVLASIVARALIPRKAGLALGLLTTLGLLGAALALMIWGEVH